MEDEYSLGAEYGYNNTFFLRGGYTFSPQTSKDLADVRGYLYDWSLGAGVKYNVGGLDLAFDYGYRNVKYFSGNNVFTLMVGF
jgi:long-subunit fatty acid transport protein